MRDVGKEAREGGGPLEAAEESGGSRESRRGRSGRGPSLGHPNADHGSAENAGPALLPWVILQTSKAQA